MMSRLDVTLMPLIGGLSQYSYSPLFLAAGGVVPPFFLKPLFIALLVLLSAGVSSLFALPREERERIKRGRTLSEVGLQRLLEEPRELLFVLQALTTLTVVAFTVVLAARLKAFNGVGSIWVAAVAGPPVMVILGMLLPRALAARFPVWTARHVAVPLWGLTWLLRPFWWPLRRVSELILSAVGIPLPEQRQLEEVQLKALVDLGHEEGTLKGGERELIHNVFEFGDVTAGELMTPRTEIVGFEVDASVREVLDEIHEHRYARVPLYRNSLDTVVGILYTRDLLKLRAEGALDQNGSARSLEPILKAPWFIPSTKRADALFHEFQSRRTHVAVVVDEYGGMEGIVTMDDLLAELFGRTLDEHDVEEPEFIELGEDEWRVLPQMELEHFCERLGMDMPETEEVNTVGGWVLGLFGSLPNAGESVRYEDLDLEVEAVQGTRLQTLKVRRIQPEPAETSEEEA